MHSAQHILVILANRYGDKVKTFTYNMVMLEALPTQGANLNKLLLRGAICSTFLFVLLNNLVILIK